MWGAHDGMGWWMVFGSVWFVIFWAAIVWLIVSAVDRGPSRQAGETPLEILKRRYARGEVSKEEYDRMRHDLA